MPPERLYRQLVEAIEWLRPLGAASPEAVEWRRYRHLRMRYLEGAQTETIAHALAVSPRQARRDHAEAVDELARLLWRQGLQALDPTRASRPRESSAEMTPGADRSGLADELAKLAAADPGGADVREVLGSVAETLSSLAAEQGVALRVAAEGALPPLALGRTLARQLLLALVSAAIVANPGAEVVLTASRADDAVVLEITPPPPASALEPWRGLLGARGVRFEGDERALRTRVAGAAGATVLVVDDNPDVAYLFERYLAGTGRRVLGARTGERALRLAREASPALIVLDVLMPAQDGWEVLRALRADPATASLPVVVCSVLPDQTLARSLGVSGFLPKPVSRAALLETLERVGA